MNLYDSLAIGDIVSLVLLCAVIFIPLGMFLRSNCFRFVFLRRLPRIFSHSLNDEGTFADFIKYKK